MLRTSAPAARRLLGLAVFGAAGALALTGCAGKPDRMVPLGQPQVIGVENEDEGTNGSIELTVTRIDKLTGAEAAAADVQDTPPAAVFYAHYTVRVAEGAYGADDTYDLSAYKWGAAAASDAEITTINFIGGSPDACPDFTSDDAATLAAGGTVEACQVFTAEDAAVEIKTVAYDAPMISYKNRDQGWRWEAQAAK